MAETHDRLIGRLAAVLASLHDVESVALRLCEAGRHMLGADGAALTVMTSAESLIVVAASNELSSQLEDMQEVVGEGPSRDALRDNMVQVANFSGQGDGRWSLMHEHGRQLGFEGRMVAVPLQPSAQPIGTLTAHWQDGHSEVDFVTAKFLGAALGTALIQDARLAVPKDVPGALSGEVSGDDWSSRAQIHQATGMIISQVGVRAEDALALLRGQAFANNTTLLDVARQIVERRINFQHFTIEGD